MNGKLWSLYAAQENIWLRLSLTTWGEKLLSASPVVRRWTVLYLLPDSLVFSFSILWLDITDVSDTRWMDTHKVLVGFESPALERSCPGPVRDPIRFVILPVRMLSVAPLWELMRTWQNWVWLSRLERCSKLKIHVCSTSIWIKLVGNVIEKLRPVFAWRSPADVFTPGLLGAVYVNHIVFLFVLVRLMRGLWF